MVAQRMTRIMGAPDPDEPSHTVFGTPLQFHSVTTLIKALKNDTVLQDLHSAITHNQYPAPVEAELTPSTIPTLFQHNEHPYTAMDDIESIMPQELETIVSTYCERFYPNVTRQTLASLRYTTEAEITNILRTPMALKRILEWAGTDPIFEPPTLSPLTPPRETRTQPETTKLTTHKPVHPLEHDTITSTSQTGSGTIPTMPATTHKPHTEPPKLDRTIGPLRTSNDNDIHKNTTSHHPKLPIWFAPPRIKH